MQIVGGIAVTQSYYQHVMLTEGSAKEVPACQLLIAKMTEGEVAMVPAQQVGKVLLYLDSSSSKVLNF